MVIGVVLLAFAGSAQADGAKRGDHGKPSPVDSGMNPKKVNTDSSGGGQVYIHNGQFNGILFRGVNGAILTPLPEPATDKLKNG
jgi:hypothetical protein